MTNTATATGIAHGYCPPYCGHDLPIGPCAACDDPDHIARYS